MLLMAVAKVPSCLKLATLLLKLWYDMWIRTQKCHTAVNKCENRGWSLWKRPRAHEKGFLMLQNNSVATFRAQSFVVYTKFPAPFIKCS